MTEASFSSFQSALEYVFRLAKEERLILAIDEYPYVARSSGSLASTLQLLIDQYGKTSKLMLILCGSSMSYMEDQVLAYKAPLYGRRTAQIKLLPFDFEDTARCFPRFSPEDKALVYGIAGGTPQYLLQMDDRLSIAENIAFGLKIKGKSKSYIDDKIKYALKLVNLNGFENRSVDSLSGGQQQRIAIARAIVNEPRLLLLDEPLGALDLKLRQDMQYELIRLKNELGITFIYVTHDQEEALTMSDTIVVMNQGYIQQMGTPEQIYNEPENAFVADFIGESNIVGGTMIRDELVEIFGAKFACVDKGFGTNKPVDVVIRPEDIDLVKPEDGTLQGIVTHLIFKGVHYEMEVTTPNGYEWLVHSTDMFPVGQHVGIHVDPFDIQIMNKPESEDEEALGVNE